MKRSLYTVFTTLQLVGLLMAGCVASDVETDSSSSDVSTQDSTSEPATQGDRDAASPDPEVAQSTQSEPLAESEVQQLESSEVQQLESSASSLPIDDFEIIPGEKFSFITASTNRRALAEQVGEAQLVDEEVHIGEGFFEPGTAVDLGDYSFKVVWSDNSRTTPIEIRELGPAWELPNGIQLGMPFEDLKTTLGEFEIFGMGWDYAGTVMLDNTTLDSYREDLILRMEPAVGVAETFSDDFQAVLGDELFNSANPHFSSLDLTLEEIIVYLE